MQRNGKLKTNHDLVLKISVLLEFEPTVHGPYQRLTLVTNTTREVKLEDGRAKKLSHTSAF